MSYASISERRRPHHDAPQHDVNPILDILRDGDDPGDPWGDAIGQLFALHDVYGMDLHDGASVVGDLPWEREAILVALGFGIRGPADDGPYTWPTLIETTAYSQSVRTDWLTHAMAVVSRRESFARLMGLDY